MKKLLKFFKKNEKKIPDGKYRVIKIGEEAIYELLREAVVDGAEVFLKCQMLHQ